MDESEWFELGSCHKPHGLKGSSFIKLKATQIQTLNPKIPLKIEGLKGSFLEMMTLERLLIDPHGKNKIKIKEIKDRTQLEQLLPFKVSILLKDRPELEGEDEFYWDDLLNWEVWDHKRENLLGKSTEFYSNGAHWIMVLDNELEIPWVDHFIEEVDPELKRIISKKPELI